MLAPSLRTVAAYALTLCTGIVVSAQEPICESKGCSIEPAAVSHCQSGNHCSPCNDDLLFAGPSCQPYGFLWTGFDATVVYDIYGHRRFKNKLNGTFSHDGLTACENENCGTKRKTLLNFLTSLSHQSSQCNSPMHGVMEMMEVENGDSQPNIDMIPEPEASEPETSQPETNSEAEAAIQPAPLTEDPPAIHLAPATVSNSSDVSNTGDSATVRVAPPMLEPPEPTLQYAPLDSNSEIPRNVIPNRSETIESNTPKSSRRNRGTPTLSAVRQMIKS